MPCPMYPYEPPHKNRPADLAAFAVVLAVLCVLWWAFK